MYQLKQSHKSSFEKYVKENSSSFYHDYSKTSKFRTKIYSEVKRGNTSSLFDNFVYTYISYLLLFPGEDFAADFGFCKEGVEKACKNTSL
jgi:hypothetical protein